MTPTETVCALVRSHETARRLQGQTRPPDDVLVHDGSAGERLRAALERDATWFWLLEDDVVPDPAALAQLLGPVGLGDALPAPVLVASKVVGPDGRLDRRSAPWPRRRGELLVTASRHRLVALRLVGWGSLLVRRDALTDHPLPRAGFAGGAEALEWTARVLAEGHGYMAPRSVATRDARSARPEEELRARVAVIPSDCWVRHERLRFAFHVGVDAMRDLRSGPRARTLAALARGAVAGVIAGR